MVSLQEALFHHIENSSWGSYDDVNSLLEGSYFISDDGSAYASVNLNLNEFSNCLNDVMNLLSELSGRSNDQGLSVSRSGINALEN